MEKNRSFRLSFLFLIFIALIKSGSSQVISNGNFEDWHIGRYGTTEPYFWETQNETGLVTVKPGPGHSGKCSACLSIQWDSMTQSFIGTAITNSQEVLPGNRPSSMTGFIKGSALNTDSLNFLINLYLKDKLIGSGRLNTVLTYEEWEPFIVPFSYHTADQTDFIRITISIIPASGNHYQSEYCVDDLSFREAK